MPDDLVIDVVRDEAERSQWSVTGYVLDGFPRTVAQAEAFFGTPHIDLPPEAPRTARSTWRSRLRSRWPRRAAAWPPAGSARCAAPS